MVAKVLLGEEREGNTSLRGTIQRNQREEEEDLGGNRRGWMRLEEAGRD